MNDPVTMRRQLVAELRRLRGDRDLTQRYIADELDWSPSKIIRIEKGSVAIGVTDLQALLRLYGVEDRETIRRLVEWARGSKRLPFNEYRDKLPPEALRFFGYESSASIIRQFEPLFVPGLLQTEEFGRRLLEGLGHPPERVETIWSARAERQELLGRDELPEMFFILDEAVVRRVVGNAKVTQRQHDRLRELNAHPRISIQIMPFDAGAYPGMLGPFTYLEFSGTEDPDVIFVEGPLGDAVIRDEENVTAGYIDQFFALEKKALPAADLDKTLSLLSP